MFTTSAWTTWWGAARTGDENKKRTVLFEQSSFQRKSIGHVGQQGDLAGALDGLGQLALMHGAGAGGAAGQDFGPLGSEPAQLGGVLIVDALHLVHAEGADLAALAAAAS